MIENNSVHDNLSTRLAHSLFKLNKHSKAVAVGAFIQTNQSFLVISALTHCAILDSVCAHYRAEGNASRIGEAVKQLFTRF